MHIDIDRLFSEPVGKAVLLEAERAIVDFSMEKKLSDGVLVGLSGGQDSVMLLCLMKKLSDENRCKKVVAVHLNHMIRGAEADRDEEFSREISKSLGIEFISLKKDIPSEAKRLSLGIEETARNERYRIFDEILQSRNDISCICVAHNATDNLETVILNMMRGAGTRGLAGISPVRDNILRPLIYSPKENITKALLSIDIPFVTDTTNANTDYSRNFVRAEILPKLSRLTPVPENMATRFSANLRRDSDFIDSEAEKFLASASFVQRKELSSLHPALFARVILRMAKNGAESVHIHKIAEMLKKKGDFSLSLPGGVSFVAKGEICRVTKPQTNIPPSYEYKLDFGINTVSETGYNIILSRTPIEDSSLNVYKKSIKTAVDFDIIEGGLSVREKRDGDSYVYGGITRKLKKLFNDGKIPCEERALLPVICDGRGILWVPGFSLRDGGRKNAEKKIFIAVAQK